MRKSILVGFALGSLLAPSAASAGGWATAGLSPSQPPESSGPGDRWVAHVEVLQHGQTPLAGAKPVLTLTNPDTGKQVDFPAKPTDEVGVYRVVVTLPARGRWDVSVNDGFFEYGGAQTHTFAPITIGPPDTSAPARAAQPTAAPAAAPAKFPTLPVLLGAGAALVAGAAAIVLARRARKKAHAVV